MCTERNEMKFNLIQENDKSYYFERENFLVAIKFFIQESMSSVILKWSTM